MGHPHTPGPLPIGQELLNHIGSNSSKKTLPLPEIVTAETSEGVMSISMSFNSQTMLSNYSQAIMSVSPSIMDTPPIPLRRSRLNIGYQKPVSTSYTPLHSHIMMHGALPDEDVDESELLAPFSFEESNKKNKSPSPQEYDVQKKDNHGKTKENKVNTPFKSHEGNKKTTAPLNYDIHKDRNYGKSKDIYVDPRKAERTRFMKGHVPPGAYAFETPKTPLPTRDETYWRRPVWLTPKGKWIGKFKPETPVSEPAISDPWVTFEKQPVSRTAPSVGGISQLLRFQNEMEGNAAFDELMREGSPPDSAIDYYCEDQQPRLESPLSFALPPAIQ